MTAQVHLCSHHFVYSSAPRKRPALNLKAHSRVLHLPIRGAFQHAGPSRTLILHEMERESLERLEQEPGGLAAADAAAFVFEASNVESLRGALKALLKAAHACKDGLPCLLVALEGEDGMTKVCTALDDRKAEPSIHRSVLIDIEAVLGSEAAPVDRSTTRVWG